MESSGCAAEGDPIISLSPFRGSLSRLGRALQQYGHSSSVKFTRSPHKSHLHDKPLATRVCRDAVWEVADVLSLARSSVSDVSDAYTGSNPEQPHANITNVLVNNFMAISPV